LQQNHGIECYLLDQVEGPEPVLTVLCLEADFHAVVCVLWMLLQVSI